MQSRFSRTDAVRADLPTPGRQGILGVALASLRERDLQVAHLGDGLGVRDGFRDLREQPLHLGAGLEVELLPVEAHPLLILDLRPRLDAEHRVVGPRVGGVDVVDVVRAHDLEPELLRELEEPRDDLPLLSDPVVLDLDEVVLAAEDLHEPRGGLPGVLPAVVQEVLRHQRRKAPGEADQAPRELGERLQVGPRLVVEPLEMGVAHQLQQVLVALDVAGDEAQVEDAAALVAAALLFQTRALGEVEFAPDEGLDPLALGHRVKINRAEQIAVVGQGQGAHAELARPLGQLVDPAGPVQQAVVRMDMEMDEILVSLRHACLTKLSVRDAQAGTAERSPAGPVAAGRPVRGVPRGRPPRGRNFPTSPRYEPFPGNPLLLGGGGRGAGSFLQPGPQLVGVDVVVVVVEGGVVVSCVVVVVAG